MNFKTCTLYITYAGAIKSKQMKREPRGGGGVETHG